MSTTPTSAEILRRLRGDTPWREMAARCGVPLGTYQGWEAGSIPSAERAADVEARLGVRVWTRPRGAVLRTRKGRAA